MSNPTETTDPTDTDTRIELLASLARTREELEPILFQPEAGSILSPSQLRQLGQFLVDLAAMEQELIFHVLKDAQRDSA